MFNTSMNTKLKWDLTFVDDTGPSEDVVEGSSELLPPRLSVVDQFVAIIVENNRAIAIVVIEISELGESLETANSENNTQAEVRPRRMDLMAKQLPSPSQVQTTLSLGLAEKRKKLMTKDETSKKQKLIQSSKTSILSNELFNLFMDETMTYSCAIFKTQNEDLKTAQLRKISLLIKKGKHEVLEIGCGWGSLAIEIVKQTGCRYTGITLSEEQLTFSKRRAKEAGLEFTSIPDPRYHEYRRSSDFIKECIFPGGCFPSLNRITTATATSSKLW
ncbi:hypothetical protein ZIOFF_001275 [Zingiber officinale]|uniref:Cyclopropane-fatty-acyl-phospholipid synthase n=1 Tax=Zingiber officinale TaxID=94328 RepID=A0A8J5IJE6_ZINOF|nr:hypothetical protein ZIOFF_001275 [Zingiber officinale]